MFWKLYRLVQMSPSLTCLNCSRHLWNISQSASFSLPGISPVHAVSMVRKLGETPIQVVLVQPSALNMFKYVRTCRSPEVHTRMIFYTHLLLFQMKAETHWQDRVMKAADSPPKQQTSGSASSTGSNGGTTTTQAAASRTSGATGWGQMQSTTFFRTFNFELYMKPVGAARA